MRRWFVTLLTLMLLTQFTWAATSKCCLSELREHGQPVELVAAQALQSGGDVAAGHDDASHACQAGHCHCHHASVATGFDEPEHSATAARAAHCVQRADTSESHIPDGLDRPNWQRA